MKFLSTLLISTLMLFLFSNCSENSNTSIPENKVIDSLVVWKSKRMMVLFSKKVKIKTYCIALGRVPVGRKQFEGDYKTPEGIYTINTKSAQSKYHKNLNISYPNADDMAYARKCGRSCGGEIKIHGLPNGYDERKYSPHDWTWGCIGLTNAEIDELYDHIQLGAPILLLP